MALPDIIKVSKMVKSKLNNLKQDKDTFDDVIRRLLKMDKFKERRKRLISKLQNEGILDDDEIRELRELDKIIFARYKPRK